MLKREIIKEIARYTFLSIIILVSVIPLIWILISSFKPNIEILNNPLSMPNSLSFRNYIGAFKLSPIGTFYFNSIFVSIFSTALGLVIFSMSAYVLSRFEFKLKNVLFMLFSMTLLIPGTALLYPIYKTYSIINLYNTKFGLIIVYAALSMPLTLFILRSYFLTLPKDIEEAAKIDGSGFIRTFAAIIMPLARPGLASAGILSFFVAWNDYVFDMILTNGNDNRTLPVAIQYFNGLFGTNYGVMFASAVLIVMPSIIIYLLMHKQIASGLVAGSIKG